MDIRRIRSGDLHELTRLRRMLWPDSALQDHRREIAARLKAGETSAVTFIACSDAGEAIGFAEASLRHEPVNGCDTSPVLFLEGIYVAPPHRRHGMARSLCAAVEEWGRSLGCTEFGSDALVQNTAGHAFHIALGFDECERVVVFRKAL